MRFDKTNFVADLLSAPSIVSEETNLIKLYVADTIAQTHIESVEIKILLKDGRNEAIVIEDWLTLDKTSEFWSGQVAPTLTKEGQLELSVKILDLDFNVYYLKETLEGVIR